jgi:hypothetical protein
MIELMLRLLAQTETGNLEKPMKNPCAGEWNSRCL